MKNLTITLHNRTPHLPEIDILADLPHGYTQTKIGCIYADIELDGYSPEQTAGEIARAVNSHAELLKALRSAVGGVGHLASIAGVNVEQWRQWEHEARAAIDKATA